MHTADTADIIDGNLASHGTPMRRLIESGAVPGTIRPGRVRGYWPPQDTFEWMQEQGMVWHTMQENLGARLQRGDEPGGQRGTGQG